MDLVRYSGKAEWYGTYLNGENVLKITCSSNTYRRASARETTLLLPYSWEYQAVHTLSNSGLPEHPKNVGGFATFPIGMVIQSKPFAHDIPGMHECTYFDFRIMHTSPTYAIQCDDIGSLLASLDIKELEAFYEKFVVDDFTRKAGL